VRVIWDLGIVKRGTLAELGTNMGLDFYWWGNDILLMMGLGFSVGC
jgi:hypothetical protein